MKPRLFSFDPVTGTTKYFHWHPETRRFTIESKVDVTDVVEQNKAIVNAQSSKGRNWRGDLHRVASIPNIIYAELWEKGIIQDQKKLRKWLNDPDNRLFRTKEGRI